MQVLRINLYPFITVILKYYRSIQKFETSSMKSQHIASHGLLAHTLYGVVAWSAMSLVTPAHANTVSQLPDCSAKSPAKSESKLLRKYVCHNESLQQKNDEMKAQYLQAQLMSNAPLKLLTLSQQQWEGFVNKCKNKSCVAQQYDQRIADLVYLTSMNQSLTQHFVRYIDGQVDPQSTMLQLQQLDRNRIKIEATQYRNPNNQDATRYAHLRSYTTADALQEITDLDSRCQYKIERQFSILKLTSDQDNCKRFAGTYKLYD
ncbi:hypothetical protein SAMN05421749_101151 [Acinetobacter marinus]|uniref:Lysozyme inhibitor LprI N-terminal domain-containing protein n=2 Tax=Acinetobacter marinus TaxID=281375 RepID=A0A1G6GLY2_9GAMM|nr:hypothetical protein SAMN05421749_101151 [Acinetobacter marinus]